MIKPGKFLAYTLRDSLVGYKLQDSLRGQMEHSLWRIVWDSLGDQLWVSLRNPMSILQQELKG